ncbi:hypothetical protein CDZ95_16930 [Mameliella alba]|nr:hypothetical protein CDZ95_16930 [Mameliella alba]
MNIPIHSLEPEERGQMLRNAQQAQLFWRAKSESAKALAEKMAEMTQDQEFELGLRKRLRNRDAWKSLVRSISTWVAALVRHSQNAESAGYLYCPSGQQHLEGTLMEDRSFRAIRNTWQALNLLEVAPDCFIVQTFEGAETGKRRFASRYRATPKLLKLTANHGITAETFSEHFYDDAKDRKILKLRATSERAGPHKDKGKVMSFRRTPKTRKLESQVQELNTYFSEQRFGGIPAPQLQRIFNNGDDPAFNWDMGGRLYAVGPGNYQSLKLAQRRTITINGEPSCEIDISASHLTLVHGLLKEPLDLSCDPYEIQGVPRLLVKKALVTMIGTGKPLKRWPRGAKSEFTEDTGNKFPTITGKQVSQILLRRFPCLNRMADAALDWSKLQFIEAEVLLRAMLCLKSQLDVPALPVHDSLIVPVSAAEACEQEIKRAFEGMCGLSPRLKRKLGTLLQ